MYKLHFSQPLPLSLEQAWDFFSRPANLEKITPSKLGLKITEHHEQKPMYAGQILSYTVTPLWKLHFKWITEITTVQKPIYFIDEQKQGPYNFWHHEHWFHAISGGVLIEDLIYYELPFGPLGTVLHRFKIEKDLHEIFNYRKEALEQIFGTLPLSNKTIESHHEIS